MMGSNIVDHGQFGPKLSGTSVRPKMKYIIGWINFLYKGDQFVVICECQITIVRSFIRHHCNWNNDQTRIIYIAREALNIGISVKVAGSSKQGEILLSKICALYFMMLLLLVVLRKVNTQNHLIFFKIFLRNFSSENWCQMLYMWCLIFIPIIKSSNLAAISSSVASCFFCTTFPSVTQQKHVI